MRRETGRDAAKGMWRHSVWEAVLWVRRPLCLVAVICVLVSLLYIRLGGGASPPAEEVILQCRGKVLDKEQKESYGSSYWQVTLGEITVFREKGTELAEETKSDGQQIEGVLRKRESETSEMEDFFHEVEKNKLLCSLKTGEAEPVIGEMMTIQGKLRVWEEASNPGQFDFGTWYRSQGIAAQLQKVEVLENSGGGTTFMGSYSDEGNPEPDEWETGGYFFQGDSDQENLESVGLSERLWRLRQWGSQTLETCLGEEDGGLISAMILGEKGSLSEETKTLYQKNGISHILSISGLHLMLLGMGLLKALQKLAFPIVVAAPLSMVIMAVYCVFTGSSVSTVRATLMFCSLLLAKLIGRSYDSLSALGLAASLQLISNPWSLMNSGFQLSYLAVVGVSAVVPRLNQIFPTKNKLIQSIMVSVGVGLVTLPVLLYQFGTYPWHSIFLNLLVVPVMAVLLWLALSLLVLAALFSTTSVFCGILAWLIKFILFYYELCCHLFEKLPVWSSYPGRPSWICIFLFYLGVILLLWRPFVEMSVNGRKKEAEIGRWQPFSELSGSGREKESEVSLCQALLHRLPGERKWCQRLADLLAEKRRQWLTAFGLLLCAWLLYLHPQWGIEVTMLDVGQGDCVVIRSDSGKIYISDCGSSSVSSVGTYRLLPFLKAKGYGEIEGIFVSHLDADHYNGILELLEAAEDEHISIGTLFLPESVQPKVTERYVSAEELLNLKAAEVKLTKDVEITVERGRLTEVNNKPEESAAGDKLSELLNLANMTDVSVVYLQSGDSVTDGKTSFFCLHPGSSSEGNSYESNNGSLVLSVKYGEFSLLLTGDVEKAGEEEILSRIDRMGQSDVMNMSGESGGEEKNKTEVSAGRMEQYDTLDLEQYDVLKVAHHGSSGSSSTAFLEAVQPKVSLVSCGRNNSYGHPASDTLERLEAVGSLILQTTESGAITIRPKADGSFTVEEFLQ
ncbi:MAG: ComEC/Rec2 family competence protein [Lachnospiraceae bacterium]|nr:ComEC/Rec2 family competence protein [Lachnospiraceae bacterium]